MFTKTFLTLALAATPALAYPWVAGLPGIDKGLLHENSKRQQPPPLPGSEAACPYNANHKPAAPIKKPYLYNHAKNGVPGLGKGGYQVPAAGDKAHAYVAPNPKTDTFIAHDGITTFNELVDAQQNVYNAGYDLAVLLTVLGLTFTDGDVVREKLSIGCDATNRTSINPTLTGSEPGLDGHNKFEQDTSLTRNDYFTHGGDNFSYNQTLFDMMTSTTSGLYNLPNMALYRYQRYQQSLIENPNFYFGPGALLIFGAATFLYEFMPSGTYNYVPNYETISSFFMHEKLPDKWINRVEPYTTLDTATQIFQMYNLHPVMFGGNTGNGTFNLITTSNGEIKDGVLTANSPSDILCFIYQLMTEKLQSGLNSVLTPTVAEISFALEMLGPQYANLGCALPLTR